MGARTAARVADDPAVTGVVGLAPWLPPDDPVATLTGKRLVAAHGCRDRITSARATARFVTRASDVAKSAQFVDMGPLGHYMLTGAAPLERDRGHRALGCWTILTGTRWRASRPRK